MNEKSSQFNVQTGLQQGLLCRKPIRLSKRDLAIAPKLLDPEALSSPSPTAIEFLSRLREVISSARGRMRAFRFKPTLLVIPEDDYFIEEPESKYKSISSSIDSMNTSSLESFGEISRIDFQKYFMIGETLSLYPYGAENFHSYSRSQHLQPLSLPAELSQHLNDQLQQWKFSDNQSSLSPNLSPSSDDNACSSSNDVSDPEASQPSHRSQQNENLQPNSSTSPTYRSGEDSVSAAWNNDNASRVSRREIVDRLAEEIAINDNCETTNNDDNDKNHCNDEPDSLNEFSDINENLFETNRSLGNMYDNITSENLVNLSNEVEKKLAQRSIVPLPEVVTDVNEGNKMKIADGIKSSSQHHSKEDSKLSQLVADLKHFTRKRKQIKTSKSLPVVSDNNWMLQPVASMSLRLSSTSSRPSISSGQLGNRSMRNNSNLTKNGISRLNRNQTKYTAHNKPEEMSQVIIQEGRYLNLNNHSPVSDDDRSIGNEITSSRCGLETWSLSSELSTGSSSSIYGKNIDNNSFGNQYILDTVTHHDDDDMFISFTGNQFESTLDESEVGYISRFNLIKKYIDNPDNFNMKDAKESDGRANELERRNQSSEKQKMGKDNISTNQIDSATNHLAHAINSQYTNQRRSIDYKHYQPSAQSLSSLTSTLPTSYSEMCSSDDGMSSASVSSIMFIESPNQGRRKSVDRRLTKGITERDDQSHYGNNVANNNNFMMKGSIRGSCNNINKMIQPSNGIRLTRQNPVQKRYFPNGFGMTIA